MHGLTASEFAGGELAAGAGLSRGASYQEPQQQHPCHTTRAGSQSRYGWLADARRLIDRGDRLAEGYVDTCAGPDGSRHRSAILAPRLVAVTVYLFAGGPEQPDQIGVRAEAAVPYSDRTVTR